MREQHVDVLCAGGGHDAAAVAAAGLHRDGSFHAALRHEDARQIVEQHHIVVGHAVDAHARAERDAVVGAGRRGEERALILVGNERHIAVHDLRVVAHGLQKAADLLDDVALGERRGHDVRSLVGGVGVRQRIELLDAVSVLLLHERVSRELADHILRGGKEIGVVGTGAVERELHAAVHRQGVGRPVVRDRAAGVGAAVALGGVVVAQPARRERGDLHIAAAGEAHLARLRDHPSGRGRGHQLLVNELLVCLCVIKCHYITSGNQISPSLGCQSRAA